MTYGGQGTLKKGVHAESHAVIYTSKAPVMKPGERITKKSIKMDPFSPRDKLDPTSRINYAKLYTVEHNVKVHFVGKVVEKHEQRVVTDYNGTHSPLTYRPYVPVNEEDSMYAEGGDTTDYDHPNLQSSAANADSEGYSGAPSSSAAVADAGQSTSREYREDQEENQPNNDQSEDYQNNKYEE